MRNLTIAGLIVWAAMMAGCWNGGNDNIHLGDVSIGQQMIDLKKALAQDAITQDEYDRLKEGILSIETLCGDMGSEDEESDD